MAPDQDLQTGTEQADTPAAAEAPRHGKRSGRGHRGRGRRRRSRAPRSEQDSRVEPVPSAKPELAANEDENQSQSDIRSERSSSEPEASQAAELPPPPVSHGRPGQPAPKASIQAAIEQVNEIIHSLKESLEQMDEVLESLEYFERQGDADEQEIESLRRSLRQLQRSREGGQHPHRGHS